MKKQVQKYLVPSHKNEYKPHIFRGTATFIVAILVITIFLVSASGSALLRNSSLFGAVYPSVLIDLANEARVENNFSALTANEKLTQAAQLKANDMAAKSYFAHTSPEGLSPWYWIGLSGYQFIYAGENLAVDFTESVDVNRAWLNSPGHAANILSSNFREIGVATAEGTYNGRKTIFVAQMFGTPVPVINTNIAGVQKEQNTPIEEVATEEVFDSQVEIDTEPEVEVVAEITTENETFVAVENTEIPEEVIQAELEERGAVQPSAAPGYERYSNWYDWIIVNPTKTIEYALYAAVALISIALLLMVFVNIRTQHPRNLAYGLTILVLLLVAIYLNRTGVIETFVASQLL